MADRSRASAEETTGTIEERLLRVPGEWESLGAQKVAAEHMGSS
jgi:hypothetical protein